METYEVTITDFQGPMDLLLHVIKRKEIDIFDIPMVEITDEFLAHLARAEALNLPLASEFVLMATKLMTIKAAMLLPKEELPKDDPRQDLVQSILEYELIHGMVDTMQNRLAKEQLSLTKVPESILEDTEIVWEELTLKALIRAFQGLDFSQRQTPAVRESTPTHHKFIPIHQCIEKIEAELAERTQVRFRHILGSSITKYVIISYFLAILELGRMLKIKLYLDRKNHDMIIQKR